LPNSQSSEEIEAAQNGSEIRWHEKKPAARSLLIDAVRGMAISLVALGHTNQGIMHRGWWDGSKVGLRLDITIYAFHMPAFFFVSGIFLYASAEKRGPGRFTVERVRTLLYPYVLWTLISAGSVELLTRFTVQRPVNWNHFLSGLLRGYGIWFLPTLFACQVFGMALRKLPGAAILAIAVLTYYFVPLTSVNWLNMAVEFVPFVAAGMWVGRGYERMERIPRGVALLVAIALFGVLFAAMYQPWTTYKNIVLLGGAIGTLMLMMLARSFGRSKAARVFAWAGEASLAIYLAGEYGQGLVRQLMVWVHIIEPYSQLIVPTIAAIVIPAWVYQHRVRLHLDWLFVAPFWKARPRGPQTASTA
jgi:fucose 4-O-acetylase-like acetyltransferase